MAVTSVGSRMIDVTSGMFAVIADRHSHRVSRVSASTITMHLCTCSVSSSGCLHSDIWSESSGAGAGSSLTVRLGTSMISMSSWLVVKSMMPSALNTAIIRWYRVLLGYRSAFG